jgi:hypothetical protein
MSLVQPVERGAGLYHRGRYRSHLHYARGLSVQCVYASVCYVFLLCLVCTPAQQASAVRASPLCVKVECFKQPQDHAVLLPLRLEMLLMLLTFV